MPTPTDAQKAAAHTQRLYVQLLKRRETTDRLERYFEGKQPLAYASPEWADFHAGRFAGFADNWCAAVAQAPAERLAVVSFRLPRSPGEQQPDGAALTDDEQLLRNAWLDQDLDEQTAQGFLSGIVTARSFALVWLDEDDEPLVTWERSSQVIVEYDPEIRRRRRAALKTWTEDGRECATLYTADWLWKFERPRAGVSVHNGSTSAGLILPASAQREGGVLVSLGGWQPRRGLGDEQWPLPNPFKVVPVVEFPNRPVLGRDPLSDIDGVVSMQDAINMLWAYLFAAADYASMPARVVMGQGPPTIPILDSEGRVIGEKPIAMNDLARDRLLYLQGANAKVGEFTAAKLDAFTDVIEVCVGHIAAQTRTPPHYLVANKGLSNVNGDGLKVAETGLVKKTEEDQLYLNSPTQELHALIALALDEPKLAKACRRGTVQWRDAETRSEAQLVDALQKLRAIGFPFQWLAERYGLSPTEVTRLVQLRAQEGESVADVARRFQQALDDEGEQDDDGDRDTDELPGGAAA